MVARQSPSGIFSEGGTNFIRGVAPTVFPAASTFTPIAGTWSAGQPATSWPLAGQGGFLCNRQQGALILCTAQISLSSAAGGKILALRIGLNGGTSGFTETLRAIVVPVELGSVGTNGVFRMEFGDVVALRIANMTDAVAFTVSRASFSIIEI